MYSLLGKSPWKWSLVNRFKKRGMTKVNNGFYKFLTESVNLFRLLENKILKIFSIQERYKSRQKFGRSNVSKTEEVRKYFVNLKLEIEDFSYIIHNLDFKNISCALFLLHMKMMNYVVSW